MPLNAVLPARRVRPVLAALVAVVALACAGIGASTASAGPRPAVQSHSIFTKVHFVADAGLAFGAFHHFIYEPLKAGDFAHPLSHKTVVAEAVLAGAFVYHELKTALKLAQSDGALSKLVAPITALEAKLASIKADITGGKTSALTTQDTSVGSIENVASKAGVSIEEIVPPLSSL